MIRFHPATEEEEVAYVSLFSYFNSRRRFGVVANSSRLIKDLYLVPLSANESIPSILQPLEGPGMFVAQVFFQFVEMFFFCCCCFLNNCLNTRCYYFLALNYSKSIICLTNFPVVKASFTLIDLQINVQM